MDPRVVTDLEAVMHDVINEARTVHPQRTILADIEAPEPLLCDRGRIGQLLANLLLNALTHGDADGPVQAKAGGYGPQLPPRGAASPRLVSRSRAGLVRVSSSPSRAPSITAGRARLGLYSRPKPRRRTRVSSTWSRPAGKPVHLLDARIVADAVSTAG